ncbi:unannotated protein [freshwater metagenome]|uniref:Unannotated protein n=1 Tax=freshwater metagenome TaxID=449393 RepID=A0A6J6CG25_9ZZZZ
MAGRYSPNTSRSAPAHSPVVTRASAHSIEGSIMDAPLRAASCRTASAAATRSESREARVFSKLAMVSLADDSSTLKMPPSSPPSNGDGIPSVHLLSPTTICSPVLMALMRSDIERTSADFMYPDSMAGMTPPISRIRSISALAWVLSSSTFDRTTTEPSNRSGYSNRSVS